MKVALDIDGTISEHPQFFAMLSTALRSDGHRVLILTYRDSSQAEREKTEAELAAWGVGFDELVFANSLEEKGKLCAAHGINLFFDDQDECIVDVPEGILVCKIRNGGNFDFEEQRWLSTARLTKLIH